MIPSSQQRGSARGIIALLMALCFISHMNRVAMSVAGKERLIDQFGLSPTQMGSVYSAFLFSYSIFMIPAGWLIDRWGARRALVAMGFGSAFFGAATGTIGFFAMSGVAAWSALLAVRVSMGIVTTPLHPGCARLVGESVVADRQPWANSLITGAALLGIACTYPVVGKLIDLAGWPLAFITTAAATAILTSLFAWMRPSSGERARPRPPSPDWSFFARHRDLILITLSYSAVGYFQYLFFYWIQYYFDDVLHFGKEQSRFYAALPTLAMAFGMPAGGWLAAKLRERNLSRDPLALTAIGAMVLSSILLLCGLFLSSPFAVVAFFTLSLGALGLSEGPFWTRAVALGGNHGGTSAAIMNTGGNGIGLLAPLLTPWISEYLGWKLGLGFGAVVALCGGLCWCFMKRNDAATPPPMKTSFA